MDFKFRQPHKELICVHSQDACSLSSPHQHHFCHPVIFSRSLPHFTLILSYLPWTNPLTRSVLLLATFFLGLTQNFQQIISSKPKAHRRGANRRAGPREQVLGKPVPSPATRARAAATVATAAAAKAVPQASEKIIVSNLPADVNEAQIKVSSLSPLLFLPCSYLRSFRTFSTKPSEH